MVRHPASVPPHRMTVEGGHAQTVLTLVGSHRGVPTLDDLTALYFKLTGKTPTPEELERARRSSRRVTITRNESRRLLLATVRRSVGSEITIVTPHWRAADAQCTSA